MTPAGVLTILHKFMDGGVANDGRVPSSLIQGTDGNLYGTTYYGGSAGKGAAFKVSTAGAYSILHHFGDGGVVQDGQNPAAALTLGSDGNFYGSTQYGGAFVNGTIFKMTPAGIVTVLRNFDDPNIFQDGLFPESKLVLGRDGNLYGTTARNHDYDSRGQDLAGTFFKINPAGAFTFLHSFLQFPAGDGSNPVGDVIQASDGSFYGTTLSGGATGSGTIFKYTLPKANPYAGGPLVIDSAVVTTLQVENYDLGGAGSAYADSDSSNNGGAYRADAVDIQATGDVGGGYNIGWTVAGEWLGYTVNILHAGNYTISARVAGAVGGRFHLEAGPIDQIGGSGVTTLASFTVSPTGGWQNWTTVTVSGVALAAGTQWIRLVEDTGGYNINYITFTPETPNFSGHVIALRALANNLYVSAENAGQAALVANRATYKSWEQFLVVGTYGDSFALRANANGGYVNLTGDSKLLANLGGPSPAGNFPGSATYKLIYAGNGAYALESDSAGLFVTANSAGNVLIANKPTYTQTEEYSVIVIK